MPPAILLALTLLVLARPNTLAAFLSGGLNFLTNTVLGVEVRTEVGRIDILRREIRDVMVWYQSTFSAFTHHNLLFFLSNSSLRL